MSLATMQAEISATNIEKGWRSLDTSVGDRISLIHSEASEALEEIRAGHAPDEIYLGVGGKPEGYPVELADIVIRVLDEFSRYGLDAETVIEQKMAYNKTRPYLHGGKAL